VTGFEPRLSLSGALFFLASVPEKLNGLRSTVKGQIHNGSKIFHYLSHGPLLIGAVLTGTSFPVLFLMFSLLLIALVESSARDEQEE